MSTITKTMRNATMTRVDVFFDRIDKQENVEILSAVVYDRSYIPVFYDFSPMVEKRDDILKKIGENIRRLRIKKNLSLRELSYRCDIDNSKISKIESGRFNITIGTLLEIAAALEVSPTDLFRGFKSQIK